MNKVEEFDNKIRTDVLLRSYADEMERCKQELVLACISVHNRILDLYPEDEPKPSAQALLADMNEHLMMEICIRAIDIIKPTWKEDTIAMMADDEIAEVFDELPARSFDIKLH